MRICLVLASLLQFSLAHRSLADDALQTSGDAPSRNAAPSVQLSRSGSWRICRSANFRICCRAGVAEVKQLASRCEELRTKLQATWLPADRLTQWTPRCDVVVHSSLAAYQKTLGGGVGRSVGCATTRIENHRVVLRRIDLRADADGWELDALPHELTHVVLADHFAGRKLSPWINEGLGVLSESAGKQAVRDRALETSIARGTVLTAGELAAVARPPQPQFRAAFYGQSATLVASLVERKTPAAFIGFADAVDEHGLEHALRSVYGMDIDALEALLFPETPRAIARVRPLTETHNR